MPDPTPLSAPYTLQYDYTRSLGAVLSAFFAGLRDGRILGAKARSGDVICPPTEYDPQSGESIVELIEVGPAGTVTACTWIDNPQPHHPLSAPFAFALIRLDGATTAMLHCVAADDPSDIVTGMRVAPRFAAHRSGHIRDIAGFVAGESAEVPARDASEDRPIGKLITPVHLDYTIVAGQDQTRFLTALTERRILGSVDPDSGDVYVPTRRCSPVSGKRCEQVVEVAQVGAVQTFCVVRIPFEGQRLKPPYVCAQILLDGTSTPLFHLIGGLWDVGDVFIGQRVRAEWVDDAELAPTLESIKWFAPVDADGGQGGQGADGGSHA